MGSVRSQQVASAPSSSRPSSTGVAHADVWVGRCVAVLQSGHEARDAVETCGGRSGIVTSVPFERVTPASVKKKKKPFANGAGRP